MDAQIYRLIVDQALQKLIAEHNFTQFEIFEKLQVLQISIGRASISNLWNHKQSVSGALLKKAAEGLKLIMERELCFVFMEESKTFQKIKNCKARPIIIRPSKTILTPIKKTSTYLIHDGRRDVHEKVQLYNQARFEILEIGIRLKNFRSYFEEKRESAFLTPLRNLLARGVDFKCYNLALDGNCAKRYIADRAIVQPNEKLLLEDIPRITTELKQLFIQLNREGHRGKIQLYQYDHFPYAHATVIDGGTENGQMNIAPYLLGLSRANTPVIELSQNANKSLFKKYWKSVHALTNSQRITQIV